MIVTLLGSLFGFLASLVPDVMKMLQDRRDRSHELAILDKQLEQQRLGFSQKLEEIHSHSDAQQAQALYATYRTDIRWVDSFNGSVRPALAYAFFLLYAGVKIAQYQFLSATIALPFDVLQLLWNDEDRAIFAAIISFYFGQRAMRKTMGAA